MPFLAFSTLWTLIGGARGLLAAAGAAAVVWSAMVAYDRLVDDPAVAAAARRDFVARAELEAERAKNAELARQVTAGQAALDEARHMADADAIADAETARRTDQEIATMEARLKAEGRSCKLTQEDLQELR